MSLLLLEIYLCSLFDSLVQLLKPIIHLHILTGPMPGPSLAMPLAYMLVLDYFLEATVTVRLRIAAKHLPMISMLLYPRHGSGHAHIEY